MAELEIGGMLKNITGDGMVTTAERVVCADGRTVEEWKSAMAKNLDGVQVRGEQVGILGEADIKRVFAVTNTTAEKLRKIDDIKDVRHLYSDAFDFFELPKMMKENPTAYEFTFTEKYSSDTGDIDYTSMQAIVAYYLCDTGNALTRINVRLLMNAGKQLALLRTVEWSGKKYTYTPMGKGWAYNVGELDGTSLIRTDNLALLEISFILAANELYLLLEVHEVVDESITHPKVWVGSIEEYNALERINPNWTYVIK